jgi:hypothetical protein
MWEVNQEKLIFQPPVLVSFQRITSYNLLYNMV